MEHGCQVATVLTLLQCCYHFMPSTVPREELLGSDEQQGVARGFLSECPFKCILWIMAHSPKRVGKFRCVCSDSLTSSGNNYNFDKAFDLILMKMMRVKRFLTRSHLYCPLCIRALTPSSRPGSTLTKRCQADHLLLLLTTIKTIVIILTMM